MTRVLVGMKFAILRNSFAKDARLRFGMLALAAVSTVGGWAGVHAFLRDSGQGPVAWSRSLAPGFNVILLLWLLGPLLMGGVDDTVDPTRLATLPLTPRELRIGLLAAGFVNVVTVGTGAALLGVVLGYGHSPASVPLVAAACAVELLFVVIAGRALAVALGRSSQSRRGRDASVVVASLAASALWLALQSLSAVSDRLYDRLVVGLRWTPSGMLGQAVIDARTGRWSASVTRVMLICALSYVLYRFWGRGMQRLLSEPASVSPPRRRRAVARPFGARVAPSLLRHTGITVLVKELHYLARSPQRRSALIVGTVMGAPFALLQAWRIGGPHHGSVWYAPLAIVFGIGASNNLLGADSRALWLETTSGVSMRALLFGRSLASVPYTLVPVLSSAALISLMSGDGRDFAVIALLAMTCWGVPVGVGCIVSVIVALPQPDDDNPHANRRPTAGESVLIGAMSVASVLAVAALLLPVVAALVQWHRDALRLFGVLVPGSLVYCLGVWLLCLRVASRRAQRREADLLFVLGRRRAVS